MKTLIAICILIMLVQITFAQSKSVKVNQLFITNNVTANSFKMNSNESTLKGFGQLLRIDTLNMIVEPPDYYKRYVFSNIIVYVSTKGKISSFEIISDEIEVKRKGKFTISTGMHIDAFKDIFDNEIESAHMVKHGIDNTKYLNVFIQLSDLNNMNDYQDIDCAIVLLFQPDTEILKKIIYWIRP